MAIVKNAERAAATRERLIASARALFAAQGFAGTATEAILEAAGVKRGALYHHFRDKAALFGAVCDQIGAEAGQEVLEAAEAAPTRLDGLIDGSVAWVAFMLRPDARRVLLIDAPTVLGSRRWREIDEASSASYLAPGIAEALDAGEIVFPGPARDLADMLDGALNGLALGLGARPDEEPGGESGSQSGSEPGERSGWEASVAALFRAFAP